MSLAIICGGLGDHTRMLAAALKMRDIPTAMVAMSDAAIDDAARRERQEALGQPIEALRLGRETPMRKRMAAARAFLDEAMIECPLCDCIRSVGRVLLGGLLFLVLESSLERRRGEHPADELLVVIKRR